MTLAGISHQREEVAAGLSTACGMSPEEVATGLTRGVVRGSGTSPTAALMRPSPSSCATASLPTPSSMKQSVSRSCTGSSTPSRASRTTPPGLYDRVDDPEAVVPGCCRATLSTPVQQSLLNFSSA